MTERETQLIRIMEYCVLNGDFCDECENSAQGYPGCRNTHVEFFAAAKAAFNQRDALLADITAVCAGKFVDICCICGHHTPEHPKDKCELKGLACKWEWRGARCTYGTAREAE